MPNNVPVLLAAVVLLIAAAGSFYRLMVGFPIIVAGVPIGQTASFFAFVICASLSFILFKSALVRT